MLQEEDTDAKKRDKEGGVGEKAPEGGSARKKEGKAEGAEGGGAKKAEGGSAKKAEAKVLTCVKGFGHRVEGRMTGEGARKSEWAEGGRGVKTAELRPGFESVGWSDVFHVKSHLILKS